MRKYIVSIIEELKSIKIFMENVLYNTNVFDYNESKKSWDRNVFCHSIYVAVILELNLMYFLK